MATDSPESAERVRDIERAMALLWQQVLDLPSLPGPSDDFFSLGGDSIAMVMMEQRIREEFSVALPDGSVLAASSLRDLSSMVAQSSSNP